MFFLTLPKLNSDNFGNQPSLIREPTREPTLCHVFFPNPRLHKPTATAEESPALTSQDYLFMQFVPLLQVCNHPELFERRDAKAPLVMHIDDYVIPKLVYDEAVIKTSIPSRRHILYNLCSIWHPQVSHENVFQNQGTYF